MLSLLAVIALYTIKVHLLPYFASPAATALRHKPVRARLEETSLERPWPVMVSDRFPPERRMGNFV